MNRGSYSLPPVAEIAERASMRPRFMNRGSQGGLNSIPPDHRRFNEAPIHESGK